MSAAAVQSFQPTSPSPFATAERWMPRSVWEVYQALPEGTRAEFIDDILYMPPAPDISHQETSMDLGSEIRAFLKKAGKGKVFAAPTDVALDGKKETVQPDLIIILEDQLHLLADGKRIRGVPAILVEILSTDAQRDTEFKLQLYARYGVREYFIIDPDSKVVTRHSEPKDGVYQSVKQEPGVLHSDLLGADFRW